MKRTPNNSYIYLKEFGRFEIAILLIYVTKECCFHKNKLSTKPKFAKREWDMIQTTAVSKHESACDGNQATPLQTNTSYMTSYPIGKHGSKNRENFL